MATLPLPSIRAHSYAESSGGTTYVNAKPAGTADGDVLLWYLNMFPSSITVPTAPAGWTQLGVREPCTNIVRYIYYKKALSEPASWTTTVSAGSFGGGCVLAIKDCAAVFVAPTIGTVQNTPGGTTAYAPGPDTPPFPGLAVLALNTNGNNWTVPVDPTGFPVHDTNIYHLGSGVAIWTGSKQYAVPASEDPTITLSIADQGVSEMVFVKGDVSAYTIWNGGKAALTNVNVDGVDVDALSYKSTTLTPTELAAVIALPDVAVVSNTTVTRARARKIDVASRFVSA